MAETSRPWVALVGPELEENLSLRYLAAALARAGFRSEIVPFNGGADFRRVLAALSAPDAPMAIALSLAFQWRATEFLALAMALRQKGYEGHITAGGHFGTFAAREILDDFSEIDSICLHEAEETIVELARAVSTGAAVHSIAGLAVRRSAGTRAESSVRPRKNLDDLPWPDRRGDPIRCLGHPIAALVGSRGCYANCAFCCIAAWHRLAPDGARFRQRSTEDVAEEMAWLSRERGVDIFIFHDDNFFLPDQRAGLKRIEELADGLAARGMGPFATVVKARPNDVTQEVFACMRERLGLVRAFLGVETDAPAGLRTLRRGVRQDQNRQAMLTLQDLGLYVCFNLLIFDPDTTLESLETNFAFMEDFAHVPFNFGRVELYAGTPLLARMQAEQRCTGDYLAWDYRLASTTVQRIFELTMACFHPRNFAAGALANRLMGTRFDVEVCRKFHPRVFRDEWLVEAKTFSRSLAEGSVARLRQIVAHVRSTDDAAADASLVEELAPVLRQHEAAIEADAADLERRIAEAVGARCQHARPAPALFDGRASRASATEECAP
jgi:anaerobic magnesium-protoporphyrin IX monomethyl ester cyclase